MNSGWATITGSLRQIAQEKLGWYRRMWRDLRYACHVSVTLLIVLILFSLFLQLPELWLFRNDFALLFECYVRRLFSVDKHVALLEENTARNPEFDYGRSKLADMDNFECKANFTLKTWSARVSWGSASDWRILVFSETKEENHPNVQGKDISKIIFISGCFARLESLALCSTLFHCLYNWQKKCTF